MTLESVIGVDAMAVLPSFGRWASLTPCEAEGFGNIKSYCNGQKEEL